MKIKNIINKKALSSTATAVLTLFMSIALIILIAAYLQPFFKDKASSIATKIEKIGNTSAIVKGPDGGNAGSGAGGDDGDGGTGGGGGGGGGDGGDGDDGGDGGDEDLNIQSCIDGDSSYNSGFNTMGYESSGFVIKVFEECQGNETDIADCVRFTAVSDTCLTNNTLVEQLCLNGNYTSQTINCTNGCNNGACA